MSGSVTKASCDECMWPSLAAEPDYGQQARIAEQDRRIVELSDKAEKLESERDGLLDQIGVMTEEISELLKKQPYTFDANDARGAIRLVGKYIDELEAKAEIAERAMNAAAGKWARADARSAERAAAVERLRNCLYTSDSDLMRAMLNWGHEPHTGDDSRFALIDLLTDEPMGAQSDGNGTCPDGNGTVSNRNPFYAVADALGVNCADRTDERIAERMLEVLTDDWMELPRDKYYEVIHLEDVMTAPGEDCWTVLAVNEGGFITFHEDGSYHMRSCRDWQHTLGPVDAQSKTEPKLTEQSEYEYEDKAEAFTLLTNGTMCVGSKQLVARIAELQKQVDELTAELAKRDKGIERLKRQRDELERALEIDGRIKASQDGAIDEIARQRDEWKALAKSYEENYVGPLREAGFDVHAKAVAAALEAVDRENDRLKNELERTRADCEEWRAKFGKALDYADEIRRLA